MLSIDGSYKKSSGLYSPEEASGIKPLVMNYIIILDSPMLTVQSPEVFTGEVL